jgi:hypothetical protein
VTENEWLACVDPMPMLEFLRAKVAKSAVGRRKLRLLACGCVRHFWEVMVDVWDRDAVFVAESYADGEVDKEELLEARAAARDMRKRKSKFKTPASPKTAAKGPSLTWPAQLVAVPAAWDAATWTLRDCADTAWLLARDSNPFDNKKSASYTGEQRWQAGLVREIFGNPFRVVTFASAWRSSDVLALAKGIYEEHAFERMPILADALQEAGCDNDVILNHCRGQGPHVRGCWVIDLILGET